MGALLNSRDIIKSTKDPVTKELAIKLGQNLNKPADLEVAGRAAMKIVETTKDADSKWMAVRILGNLQYQPAVPMLLKGLSDSHHYVRANAPRALGDMKVADAAKPMIELLAKEKDGGVLQQTSLALANLHAVEAIPSLKRAVQHEDPQTRMWILQAVGRLGSKSDVAFLGSFLSDPHTMVQVMAAEAIETVTGVDFGFPKRSGFVDLTTPLERAKAWWAEHQGDAFESASR